ncbi:hypothetical protein PMIN06_000058 [Paraphaeosphaeria minitans]
MISMCSGSNTWSQPPLKMKLARTPDDDGLSFSDFEPPPDQFMFVSDLGQRDETPAVPSAESSTLSGQSQQQDFSSAASVASFAGGPLYPPQPSFTATNIDDMHTHDALDGSWMLPLQTRFDADAGTFESHDSSPSISTDESRHSATSTATTQWSYRLDREAPSPTRRRESIHSPKDSVPCPTGRRRTSERAEPGSARAVYLEKNRNAASKCRTKQKRQQKDLVETARVEERKNKVLKSEVEFLKSDLRDLMELVGKHNECPDGRLRRYIQLEADRLSKRGNRNTVAEFLSLKAGPGGDKSSPAIT